MRMAGSSADLNKEIYDSEVVVRYCSFSSRIVSLKLKDSLGISWINDLSAIADIIPTKTNDAL